jgi:ribA/ribD-fused uncharacterized protein
MKAQEFDPNGDILKKMLGDVDCKEVKALGRKVQNFDKEKWHLLSRFHMRDALALKFKGVPHLVAPEMRRSINRELKDLLLSTGDAVLAEAAPRDTLWGIGYGENNPKAQDPSQWRGKNVLGNMLMYLRDKIKEGEM